MNRWNWPAHMRHPDIGTVAAVRRVEHAVRSIHPAASVTVLIGDDGKVDEDAARSGLVLYIGPDGYHWEGVLPYVFAREFRERDLVRIRLPGAAPAPAHVEISSPFAIGLSMQKPAHQMRPIFPMRVGDGRWSFSGPPGRYEVWCWDAIAVSAPRGALMTLDLVAGENPPVVVPTNENWPLVGRLRIRVRNAVGGPTSIRRMTITGLEPSSFSQSYEGDVLGTGIDVLVPCGPVEVSVIDLEGRVAAKESVEVDSAGRDVTLTLDDTP
ncbi:MAG: hypothetical protein R3F20_17080 [Planctomycetota bacterium]